MDVSVVIPAYNAGRFLEEAVLSALNQTLPPAEVIVVNDGSAENYHGLCSLSPIVRVIDKPNGGTPSARNRGFEEARSEYVANLDADDVWLPWKLKQQMAAWEAKYDAIFTSGVYWQPHKGRWEIPALREVVPACRPLTYPEFLCGLPAMPSSMIVRKSVWASLRGFDESRPYGEDQDFYFRLSHAHRTLLVASPLVLYRKHSAAMTASIPLENHWADLINRTLSTLGTEDAFGNRVNARALRRHVAERRFVHGHAHFWDGDLKIARTELRMALRAPTVKRFAYWLGSLIPFGRRLRRSMTLASSPSASELTKNR